MKYLEKELVKKEYTVLVEPRIKTIVGLRKPDLVFWKTDLGVVWVVDISILVDNFSLNPHIEKVNYYSKECITSWAKAKSGMSNVLVSACILNWRGTLSKTSYDELLPIGWSKRVWMIMRGPWRKVDGYMMNFARVRAVVHTGGSPNLIEPLLIDDIDNESPELFLIEIGT